MSTLGIFFMGAVVGFMVGVFRKQIWAEYKKNFDKKKSKTKND